MYKYKIKEDRRKKMEENGILKIYINYIKLRNFVKDIAP